MVEKKNAIFGIIAIIIGASGLGLGAFSIVNFQLVEGPQGIPGEDGQDGVNGTDGRDAPGGFIVKILDPDYGENVSGHVTIRAIVYGSINYSVSIFRNSTEIGNTIPTIWNTETVNDGVWNITIIAIDHTTSDQVSDTVIINVKNKDYVKPIVAILDVPTSSVVSGTFTIRAIIIEDSDYLIFLGINGSFIEISLPYDWDTTALIDGWKEVELVVIDSNNNLGSDSVLVYVENNPSPTIYVSGYVTLDKSSSWSWEDIFPEGGLSCDTTVSFHMIFSCFTELTSGQVNFRFIMNGGQVGFMHFVSGTEYNMVSFQYVVEDRSAGDYIFNVNCMGTGPGKLWNCYLTVEICFS
jgi:hypothetical protein